MAEEKFFILCNLDALSEIMAGNINDAITFFLAPYFVCSLLIFTLLMLELCWVLNSTSLACTCWGRCGRAARRPPWDASPANWFILVYTFFNLIQTDWIFYEIKIIEMHFEFYFLKSTNASQKRHFIKNTFIFFCPQEFVQSQSEVGLQLQDSRVEVTCATTQK